MADVVKQEATLRPKAVALVKKLLGFIGRVRVGIDATSGRCRPEFAPGDVWRSLPGIIRATCDLAEQCGIEADEVASLRDIAETIDKARAPGATK